MEKTNKDVNNYIVIPSLGWLLIAFLLTCHTSNSLYLPPIPLFDPTCDRPTTSECSTESKNKAKEEIRKSLPSVIEKIMGARETLTIPKLIPASYTLFITDKGSESQWEISYPRQVFPSGKIDLMCDISSKQVHLKNGGQIELATVVYTEDIQKDINETIQRLDEFQVCNFLVTEQKQEFHFPPNTIVGPNETVSWKMLIKPNLEFKINLDTLVFIFVGWFAIIGALFALIKQFISVAKKGMSYFDSEYDL